MEGKSSGLEITAGEEIDKIELVGAANTQLKSRIILHLQNVPVGECKLVKTLLEKHGLELFDGPMPPTWLKSYGTREQAASLLMDADLPTALQPMIANDNR